MSSTSKGMLDIISKSFTTKAHSYDGYNILYEISRYRNSKQKPNSVDDELYNFSKDNTNIKAITHITEKYWELAKISLAITKP